MKEYLSSSAEVLESVSTTLEGLSESEAAKSEKIKIYEAENPYEECDFIASDIKRKVMGGAKYSEFGIVARSVEQYRGIIDVSFESAKLPLFITSAADFGSYDLVRLIYSALAVVLGGFRRRDVISYAKCSLSGMPSALTDRFELYTESWQIDGDGFRRDDVWNMNPDGYTKIRSAAGEKMLLSVDEARQMLIPPLLALEESFKESKTVEDFTRALYNFLVSLGVPKNLMKKSRSIKNMLGGSYSKDLERLFPIICELFDEMVMTAGSLSINAEGYKSLLKTVFSETKIGHNPQYL